MKALKSNPQIKHMKENRQPNIQKSTTKAVKWRTEQKNAKCIGDKVMQHQPSTRTTTYRPQVDLTITEEAQSACKPSQSKTKAELSTLMPRCYSGTRYRRRHTTAAHSLADKRSKLDEHVENMLTNQKIKEKMFFKQTANRSEEQGHPRQVMVSQFEKCYNLSKQLRSISKIEREATLSKYIAERSLVTEDKEEELVAQELVHIVSILDNMFTCKSQRVSSTFRSDELSAKPTVLSLVLKIRRKLEEAYRARAEPCYRKAMDILLHQV